MSNGKIGSTKIGGASQSPRTDQSAEPQKSTKSAEEQPAAKAPALSEKEKGSMKTLHQLDGATKEAALRASIKPKTDERRDQVKRMITDGTLDPREARNVINLAKDDAKLRPAESDPKKLEPALINIYVRGGVPVDEARRLAGKTLEIAKDAKQGAIAVSTEAPKEKMTKEKADRIRTEAEEATGRNVEADQKWTVDRIQKDRAGFMRHVVQIDADKNTKADFKACAPTSMLGGILLSKPEAAQGLAKKLQSPAGVKEFPELQKEPAKSAVQRIASGNMTPRDFSILSNGLYASSQYQQADGQPSEGMSTANQMALQGRLRNIGFVPPPMRQDTYGTLDRQGTHVTAFAHNTGYDPWPYPGSGGQSTLTDGDAAARSQGLAMGPRLGIHGQQRALLERMHQDGQGGILLERHVVDGKEYRPPLQARYTYNEKERQWEREASAKVPAGQEDNLPKYIPVDVEKRRGMKMENE